MNQLHLECFCILLCLSFQAYVAGQEQHHSLGVDAGGCQLCEAQFKNWLSNRTKETYWNSLSTSTEVADHLCSWTWDIYYECYDVCGRDTDNNTVSFTEDSRAKSLLAWHTENCLQGECRLADAMKCRYSPPKSKCDASVLTCLSDHKDAAGCEMEKLCTASERRAYISYMENRVDCYLGYEQNKQPDRAYTVAEEQGLQQCKDILLTHCLKSWSITSYGWENIVNFTPDNKQQFCSTQNYVNICVNNLVEGVLFYRGTRYSAACNPELLQYPDHIQKTKQEITAVYTRLCSENVDPCSDPVAVVPEDITENPTKQPAASNEKEEGDIDSPSSTSHDGDHSGVHITDTKKSSNSNDDDNSAASTITSYYMITLVLATVARGLLSS